MPLTKGSAPISVTPGFSGGHVHQMLAPAKADLQPQRAACETQVQRRAVRVVLPRDAAQGQRAQILGQIVLLAGAQGLAMDAAIEIAALGMQGFGHDSL